MIVLSSAYKELAYLDVFVDMFVHFMFARDPRDHSACSGELPGQTERRRKASRFLNSNGSRQQNVGRSGEDDHQ